MYRRRKTVSIDGAEFTISPLTIEQVEQLVAPAEELQENKSGIVRVYEMICTSLNNAIAGGASPAEPWTPARIKHELDQYTVAWLQDQVLAMSGLRAVAESPTGESIAAAPMTAVS